MEKNIFDQVKEPESVTSLNKPKFYLGLTLDWIGFILLGGAVAGFSGALKGIEALNWLPDYKWQLIIAGLPLVAIGTMTWLNAVRSSPNANSAVKSAG